MQHEEQTKENGWDCTETLFGHMQAHKTNEFPIQTLWQQSILIAPNTLRKVLPNMGRGWPLCLNVEEETVW